VKIRVEFEGGELNVETTEADGLPALLVLPGGPGLSYQRYKPSCDKLSGVARLVYIDPPGCGKSSTYPKDSMDMEQYVRAILTIKAFLSLDKVGVIGFSYGSMVAMKLMSEYPDMVSSCILIGGAPSYHFLDKAKQNLDEVGSPEQKAVSERLWSGSFETQEQAQEYFRVMGPLYTLTASSEVPAAAGEADAGAASGSAAVPGDASVSPSVNIDALNVAFASDFWHFDLLSRMSDVTCPVLALTGEKDWVNDPSYLIVLRGALPARDDICALAVPGAGHSVHKDQANFFRAAVSFWVERTMGSAGSDKSSLCSVVSEMLPTS